MKSLKVFGMFVLMVIVSVSFAMEVQAEITLVKEMGNIRIAKIVDDMTDEISYTMTIEYTNPDNAREWTLISISHKDDVIIGILTTGIFDKDYSTDSVKTMFRFDDRPAYSSSFMVAEGLRHAFSFNSVANNRLIDDMKKSNVVLIKLDLYRGNDLFKIPLTGFTAMYNEYLKLSGN